MIYVIRNAKILGNCVNHIQNLPSTKVWQVKITEAKKDLTAQQRNFFHQCVDIIADFNGDEPEDIKMRIKYAVLPLREIIIEEHKGFPVKTYMVPVSTESLTRKQYSELIDAALLLGSTLGLAMPSPSSQGLEI